MTKAFSGSDFDFETRTKLCFETTLLGFAPDYIHYNGGAWDYRVSFGMCLSAMPKLIHIKHMSE
jgi:hypothetical protein